MSLAGFQRFVFYLFLQLQKRPKIRNIEATRYILVECDKREMQVTEVIADLTTESLKNIPELFRGFQLL